jgi:hypothetical protein
MQYSQMSTLDRLDFQNNWCRAIGDEFDLSEDVLGYIADNQLHYGNSAHVDRVLGFLAGYDKGYQAARFNFDTDGGW